LLAPTLGCLGATLRACSLVTGEVASPYERHLLDELRQLGNWLVELSEYYF
jgi:hypothetical protein